MTGDTAAAARLVSFAATPRALPARDPAYAELVVRYLAEPAFAEVVQDVAAGLGLEVRVDQVAGVLAYSDSDGPFRRRLADIVTVQPGRNANETRVLFALVVLAVARTAFPQAAHLSDTVRVARVDADTVMSYVDRLVEEIGAGVEDAEADREEAEEGWRAWSHLRVARAAMARFSSREKAGLIRRVCGFLEDEGHLRPSEDGGGQWWRTTHRFRFAVHTLVTDSQVVPALRALVAADVLPSGDGEPAELP
ncbi:MAG: hypothetical protein ACRD12_21635 [Acidimicrobiales bacterium]